MAIPENPITRKEHFLAKAAGESVNTPEPVTREEMYLDAIASGSGGGGGGADNRFFVTLTPTAADYSGTMDKTPAEIDEAWKSGKSIWFETVTPKGTPAIPLAGRDAFADVVAYRAYLINTDTNTLISITTHTTESRYVTKIYQLTTMGN